MSRNETKTGSRLPFAWLALILLAAFVASGVAREATPAHAAAGTFQFANDTFTVPEGGTLANVVVTRSGGSLTSATVKFVVTLNTAEPADLSVTEGLINFSDGQTSRTLGFVQLPPGGDADTDPDTFTLTLELVPAEDGGGGALGAQSTTLVTIVDDDGPPQFQFSQSTYQVNETAGAVTITVTRSGLAGQPVSVQVSTQNGTAVSGAGNDYTAVNNLLLQFDGDDLQKTFNVTILNDGATEPTQQFSLVLSGPLPSGTTGPNATVEILDDDGPGQIRFVSSTYTVNEAAGTANIDIERINGSGGVVTVRCETVAGGSASVVEDYEDTDDMLTWANGELGIQTCTIPIVNDLTAEGLETVNLALTNVVGASLTNPSTAVLTIDDSDSTGVFSFQAASYTLLENAASILITVVRTGGAGGPASVHVASSDGTATAGDYTPVNQTLSFANTETSKTFLFDPIDDLATELTETVLLTLSNPTNGTSLGSPSTATVNIVDNDTTAPVVSGLTPNSGPTGGSTFVNIAGDNFTGVTSVTFGGVAAIFIVENDNLITAVSPPGGAGVVDVRASGPQGMSVNIPADDFTYVGLPTVTNLAPINGPIAGGTVVTITGTSFTGATSVTFGGVPATTFQVTNGTTIVATAPAHADAVVDVRVTTPNGISPNTAADNYTYGSPVQQTLTYTLSLRWTLLTWGGIDGIGVFAALAGAESPDIPATNNVSGIVTAVYTWDDVADEWLAFFPGAVNVPGANDLVTLETGLAYWVAINGVASTPWTVLLD